MITKSKDFIFLILLQLTLNLSGYQNICGQSIDFKQTIEKAEAQQTNGDFAQAIETLKSAKGLSPRSSVVNYRMSEVYFALKRYKKAKRYSKRVIRFKKGYEDGAFLILGSSFDLLNKPHKAIATYRKGLKKFPNHPMIYFHLGLTLFNIELYAEAESALIKSLYANPMNPSTHLLLAYLELKMQRRVQCILALYNFLLMEPKSERAETAFTLLGEQLKGNYFHENDSSTIVNLGEHQDDPFKAAELSISLLEISGKNEKYQQMNEMQLFAMKTESFFNILGRLKGEQTGFWWEFYVNFFAELALSGNVEAFSYYIAQTKTIDAPENWLENNSAKVTKFSDWMKSYE